MKKQLKEWGILAGILLIVFYTGLNKDIAALAQRAILTTGVFTADTAIPETEIKQANYNLPLVDLKGNRSMLSDFRGKVIFLNFWATWCPPCIAEMPGIQDLYEQIGHQNIAFILLSMDKNPATVKKFIFKKGYDLPVYMPSGKIPEVFNSPTIPTTYVVSPEGKIISKHTGMAKYNTGDFIDFLKKAAQ